MLLQAPPPRKTRLGVKRCATCQEREARRLSASSGRSSRGHSSVDSRATTESTTSSRSQDTDETAVESGTAPGHGPRGERAVESRWRRAGTIILHDIPAFASALIVVMTCGGVNPSRLAL
ncbi:hypothetical protein Q8F55_005487 [Vanrija albida]|uniref:Uncharacterized protein n=1 Tax=Vanrija albida TaxID=181172 RepID=A0ABR3Q1S6_9TREE